MIQALYTAASGMLAQQMNVDTISNNLANVSTTGFKKTRVDFQDLLYHTIKPAGSPPTAPGVQSPVPIQVGEGVRPVSTPRIFFEGEVITTDNPLDLMVEGDGFFQVLQPDGSVAYTRDGSWKRDSTGRIVNNEGLPMEPEINLPPEATRIVISSAGQVGVNMPGSTTTDNVGQIQLARFLNPAGLHATGKNLFYVTEAAGDPMQGTPGEEGFGTISQGALEQSNVKVVEELVNMIVAQRAYEINSKAVQTSDDMLQAANNLKR
jgi:flagellar basal-body rod protein FlgG